MTQIEEVKSEDLKPDEKNLNRHTLRGEQQVERSLEKFGFRFAGTVDRNRVIVHGNNRHEKAEQEGIEDVVIVKADPKKQYFLQYDDLDMSDPDNPARELSVVANRTAQVSIDLDMGAIAEEANEGLDLGDWYYDWELKQANANPNDVEEIWEGMPEYVSENNYAWKTIKVHFANDEDMQEFARIIGQKLTPKTLYIWHPPQKRDDILGTAWITQNGQNDEP